jgi:hypothetical protein
VPPLISIPTACRMRRSHERPPLQPFGPSCSTRRCPRVRNLLLNALLSLVSGSLAISSIRARAANCSSDDHHVPVLGEVLAGVVGVRVAALEPAACLAAVLHLEVFECRGLVGGGSGLALLAPIGWGEEGRRVGSGGEVLRGRRRHGGGWRCPPHGEHHLAGIHGVLRLSELNLGMMDLGDAEQVEKWTRRNCWMI